MSGIRQKLVFYKEKYPTLFEIVRFLIVGAAATALDFFVMGVILYAFDTSLYPKFYNVFYGGGVPKTYATVVSTGCGFICGLGLNYVLSVLFVFNEKGESKSVKGAVIFAVLSLIGLGLHYLGMYIGFGLIRQNEWVVKIIMTFVVLVYNYLSKRLILFRDKKKTETTSSDKEQNFEHKDFS